MREQDILKQIKASADSVEIPESLHPDKIEEMLKAKAVEWETEKVADKVTEENVEPREALTKNNKVSFRFQPKHLMAAAVALVFMIGMIPLGMNFNAGNDGAAIDQAELNETNKNEASGDAVASIESAVERDTENEDLSIIKKQDAGELYVVAKSYEEIYDFIESEVEFYYDDLYAIPDGAMNEGFIYEVGEAIAESATTGGSASTPIGEPSSTNPTKEPSDLQNDAVEKLESVSEIEYSETNVQMAGVDESDIVKTNGTHIFSVKDDVVYITEVKNGEMKQVGTIAPKLASFSDRVLEMYVDGDRLVLIMQQAKDEISESSLVSGGVAVCGVGLAEAPYEISVDVAYSLLTTYNTVLCTYDISNPERPVEIGRMEQDGNYQTSRKIDDVIYLFTYDGIVLDVIAEGEEEKVVDLLPTVNGETFSYDSIYLPESGTQGLVVSSVSLDKPTEVVDKTLILNENVQIYVSSEAMYLYNWNYLNGEEITEIAKFCLEKGRILAVGASSVPGTIQDTFAINEHEGNLRVLTTGWGINGSSVRSNQLYIFDEKLSPAGKIENIAPGESIYAARYFGDLAYFITYRNIDPLFAVDLSDIDNPKILGELEITGYSEYLHMWGEDKLLGIGYETNPKTGSREGIKLVMFDISNPAELSIIDTVVLKEEDYSAALFNYKCVLADRNVNIIGFTTTDYDDYGYGVEYRVYSFADGKFQEETVVDLGKAKSEERIRGLYVGDYFYIVENGLIRSFNRMDEYKSVSTLEF